MNEAQILTAAQMRAAEQAIFETGTTEFELMQVAAQGAFEWIRRIAAGRAVTVLCGPGNNGGDGYVIAAFLRQSGNDVQVIAPTAPRTDTARQALKMWNAPVQTSGGEVTGEVLVDCLFGSGLSRPLSGELALLLRDLAERHAFAIAIDVPSGIASDTGALLNDKLPEFDVTLALGGWKFAHWLSPGRHKMGRQKLVPLGIAEIEGAACAILPPKLAAPAHDAHKYTRGLAAIVGGAMPGAGELAAEAAMRAGAGYVKLFASASMCSSNPGLVVHNGDLSDGLIDQRIDALLIGPGLGRSERSAKQLTQALSLSKPLVLDADALNVLKPAMLQDNPRILATPHDGELERLCRSFSVVAEGRRDRAVALAKISSMVILAKGPNTLIAAPDGRLALAPPASSWLSVAGSGDVLAGIAVSRMATGRDPFDAACEAVWLHGEAARLVGPAHTALALAQSVSTAFSRCL